MFQAPYHPFNNNCSNYLHTHYWRIPQGTCGYLPGYFWQCPAGSLLKTVTCKLPTDTKPTSKWHAGAFTDIVPEPCYPNRAWTRSQWWPTKWAFYEYETTVSGNSQIDITTKTVTVVAAPPGSCQFK